jgi:lipoate-protein ligase B
MIRSIENVFQFVGRNSAFNDSTLALKFGVISLPEVDLLMRKLAHWRLEEQIPDTLLLMAHPPSLAVGAKELNREDLLQPLEYFEKQGIYLHKHIRGGGITYHWDGQLVCYPIFKLKPNEQNIGNYMYRLEEIGLRTLKDLGIVAERKREKSA